MKLNLYGILTYLYFLILTWADGIYIAASLAGIATLYKMLLVSLSVCVLVTL